MPFPWSGNKDPSEADGPELFEASDERLRSEETLGDPNQLADALGTLGKMLFRANQQISACLARVQVETTAGQTTGLAGRIDALTEKIDRLLASSATGGDAGEVPPALPKDQATATAPAAGAIEELLQRVDKKLGSLGEGAGTATSGSSTAEALRKLQRQFEEGLGQLADRLAPPKKAAGRPASSAQWEQAILGPVLAANAGLDFQRQQLVRGVLDADPSACSLAGQLLVFQSASAERMPQLLKDIGEAYYRWQPKTRPGSNPMEEALVAWLKGACEKAGIGNTIELVHPGERFDSTRHTATTRGVEIAEVCGWIVLRDNGKVYTKANVAAH